MLIAKSETKDWVIVWVKDLHRRAGNKCFWEEEQERIDLGICCLIALHFLGNKAFIPTVTVA